MNIIKVHECALGSKFLYDDREWELCNSPDGGKELFYSTTLHFITDELSLDDLFNADFNLFGYSFKELLEMQESTEGIIAVSLDNIDNLPECYRNGGGYSIGKALNILSNCFTSKDLSHLLLYNKSFLLK